MSDNGDPTEPLDDSVENSRAMLDLSRFWLRKDIGLPAKDCWLLIPPSVPVHLTPEIQEVWLAKAKECRRLRGDFLVAGFEIEYSVDRLISEVLFADSPADGHGASKIMTYQDFSKYSFDKLFLKSGENQFGRKITLLKKLSEEFPTLGTLIPNDLFDRLRKIMDVRNIFAHYPIVLILEPRAAKSEVHALLIRAETPIEINGSYLDKQVTLFSTVDNDLSKVLEQFKKEPLKEEPRGIGKPIAGRIYLGHADLNVEKWLGIESQTN
jgi:hypothetical protein